MKGNIQNLFIAGYECLLYLPQEYCANDDRYPVVYVNGEDNIKEIMEVVEPHFGVDCAAFMLLSVAVGDWNDDLTPWPAPPLAKNDEPFKGDADNYLHILIDDIKPFMDEYYRTKPEPSNNALIGYSLGGLTALYALYKTDVFGKVGSLSGSLWYDGLYEFMDSHRPINAFSRVYMSLGKGEEHNRNQRMAKVGDCTRKAAIMLKDQLECKENIILEWNEGGHFAEIPKRFEKALLWLLNN